MAVMWEGWGSGTDRMRDINSGMKTLSMPTYTSTAERDAAIRALCDAIMAALARRQPQAR